MKPIIPNSDGHSEPENIREGWSPAARAAAAAARKARGSTKRPSSFDSHGKMLDPMPSYKKHWSAYNATWKKAGRKAFKDAGGHSHYTTGEGRRMTPTQRKAYMRTRKK